MLHNIFQQLVNALCQLQSIEKNNEVFVIAKQYIQQT